MHIADVLRQPGPHISFEFFPPRTEEAAQALFEAIRELAPINPSFVSVTYGAGGSTRELTRELVVRLQRETHLTVVAHVTTMGATRDEIIRLLETYVESGIENVLALRGDPPRDNPNARYVDNGFPHAADLVAFIKKRYPHLGIGVAGFPEGHPETPNRLKEMEYLKAKVDAGADYICTQLFFDNYDFYDFCERCEIVGIKVPILAGLMPITTRAGFMRMAELTGARIPAKLLRAILRAQNDEEVERIGIHWATQQAFDLYDRNVAGIHFYTLNRSRPTLRVYEALAIHR